MSMIGTADKVGRRQALCAGGRRPFVALQVEQYTDIEILLSKEASDGTH
jgi:hypothetical protein